MPLREPLRKPLSLSGFTLLQEPGVQIPKPPIQTTNCFRVKPPRTLKAPGAEDAVEEHHLRTLQLRPGLGVHVAAPAPQSEYLAGEERALARAECRRVLQARKGGGWVVLQDVSWPWINKKVLQKQCSVKDFVRPIDPSNRT